MKIFYRVVRHSLHTSIFDISTLSHVAYTNDETVWRIGVVLSPSTVRLHYSPAQQRSISYQRSTYVPFCLSLKTQHNEVIILSTVQTPETCVWRYILIANFVSPEGCAVYKVLYGGRSARLVLYTWNAIVSGRSRLRTRDTKGKDAKPIRLCENMF